MGQAPRGALHVDSLGLALSRRPVFLVSHIPPKAVNLDAVISALVFLENVLVAPRKLLLWLWPWETIASGLIWVLTVINSLVWGAVLATLKVAWQKAAVRGQR